MNVNPRKRRRLLAVVVAMLTLAVSVTATQAAATAAEIGAGKTGVGWHINSAENTEAKPFLEDATNFGPAGTVVGDPVTVVDDTETITVEYLNSVDVLFDGWSWRTQWSATELDLVDTWVNAGGVLVSSNDDGVDTTTHLLAADALSNLFGAPILSSVEPANEDAILSTPRAGTAAHPVVNGPFGVVADVVSGGTIGNFGPGPAGFTVLFEDPSGNATVIERAVGEGHVILVGDEGFFRRFGPQGGSLPSGDNEAFTGNVAAHALDLADPGTPASVVTVTTPPAQATDFNVAIAPVQAAATTSSGTITSYAATGLPDGLTMSPTGLVTGTPTRAGTFGVVFDATDSNGTTANSQLFAWTITETRRCFGQLVTIVAEAGILTVGTDGVDVVWGTTGPDRIRTLEGNDLICARGGADFIHSGVGDDSINAGPGDDTAIGGAGADTILGRRGADTLRGKKGADTVRGGGGNDIVKGNNGADALFGNRGDDRLNGGNGTDACAGGPGTNRLFNCE